MLRETTMPRSDRAPATPRRLRRLAVLLAAVAVLGPAVEAEAQTRLNQPPIVRRGGGGGIGVGSAIGLGLGLLGAAAAANAAQAEDDLPPPRRGREPRRVRVIEVDDDGEELPPPRRGGGTPPPKDRPPRAAERGPTPTVQVPARAETRYVPGEVLIELRGNARIEPLAGRLRLEPLEAVALRLTGSTLHRLRARDGRSTASVLARLRDERTVAFAQPNWLYTLQEDTPADPRPTPPEDPSGVTDTTTAPDDPATIPPGPPPRTPPHTEPSAPNAETDGPPGPRSDAAPPAASEPASLPAPAVASIAPPAAAPEPAAPLTTAAAVTAAAPAPAALPGQYAADKLNLAGAHGRVQGREIRVAVIDTGADLAHPELAEAVEATFDALPGVDPTPGAHGTAMAGAVAARLRLTGSAPAARLLAARAFGPPAANGVAQGSTLHVVKCLDWAVDRGARVLSLSFAGPSDGLLGRTLAAAQDRGVVAVAAAGNAGPQSPPLHPAATAGVVAVTASDPDDRILPQAVRGGHVLVTAPGVDILVATPSGGYDLTSGTSVAAAEVAGVVALLLERRPDLKPEAVRRLLADTAIDLGPRGRDPIFGAGLVDAAAAVAATDRLR